MSFQGMKTTKTKRDGKYETVTYEHVLGLHLGLISRRIIKITVSIPFEWTLCLRSFRGEEKNKKTKQQHDEGKKSMKRRNRLL